ncbi:ankyrin repeat-containing domain protein [Trichoderma sp. SZMC 28015]
MPASQVYSLSDYTIGWVCALSKEQTAATAMLDARHDDLPNPPNDPNAYTLGSIGKHNIAIACLPEGRYGNNAAASAAAHMVSTFPSLRFGLMVGIGGGVPSNEIRLGDVVVSKPDSRFSGVIQWDLGKIEQGRLIEHTGSLNNPPTALLTALAKLRTKREMEGSRIPNHLATMGEKWPNLIAKYTRSQSLRDVLFADNYQHIHDPSTNGPPQVIQTCDTETEEEEEEEEKAIDCRFCDMTKARKRKPRATRIHYGLIASGNMVIKDAHFRNRLNERFDSKILCVEMEAAGLMNDFPCLVIRGICDYADSHKNKAWQEYAAAVAAAFAKELLLVLPSPAVEQMDTVTSILSNIRRDVGFAVEYLKDAKTYRHYEEDKRIINWLSPLDYGAEHSDVLQRWHPGTCQWLLKSPEFREFIERNDTQVLFCPGIPGAGKTVMAAKVIDYLHKQFINKSNIGIIHVYFNFKRYSEQDPNAVFLSLLRQLTGQQLAGSLTPSVTSLYDRHAKRNTRPSLEETIETFQKVVESYLQVFLVVDALDECATLNHCRDIILTEIIGVTKRSKLKLFATARHIPEISERFKHSLCLEIGAVESDIRSYLDSRLSKLSPTSVISQSEALQEEIKAEISVSVSGMFLLAQLHFDQLTDCITRKAVLKTLKALPTGSDAYDYTYNAAMDRINHQSPSRRRLSMNVLSWITHAMRPLSVIELQYALGVETEADEFDEDNLPQLEDIISTSLGLVTFDKRSKVIRLVHHTTQEFFERNLKRWFPSAKTYIAEVCSCYLSSSASQEEFREFKSKRGRSLKLFSYAATYWQDHVSMSDFSQRHVNFLKKPSRLRVFEYNFHRRQPNPKYSTGLHIAAESGWNEIVEILLQDIADADARDEFNRTPFYLAASSGHSAVMRTLLSSDQIDVNVISSESRYTPLICAAQRGHAAAVKLLLDTGKVNAGFTCKRQKAALWYAVVGGHVDAMLLLLNAQNYDSHMVREIYSSALLGAVIMQQEPIVQVLLETGYADVNVQTTNKNSPFFWDFIPNEYDGYSISILSFLGGLYEHFDDTTWKYPSTKMKEEADNRRQPMGYSLNKRKSPLCLAVEFDCENLARILLSREETNVDLPANDGYSSTALSIAARYGSIAMFQLLLESGRFDINPKDNMGQTPLMIAISKWRMEIVELLLGKNSLAIDLQDKYGRTALFRAVEYCQHQGYDIARLLINTGKANVGIKDARGHSPLSRAVMYKNEKFARLLVGGPGVDINIRDERGRSLLSLAVFNGSKDIVKLFIDTGRSDINARDLHGLTPLLTATQLASNRLDIIRVLLDANNIDVNARDYEEQRSALLWAAYAGDLESLKALLQTGKFDINERDGKGFTALTLAAQSGKATVLQYLLNINAVDLHSRDYKHNRTALILISLRWILVVSIQRQLLSSMDGQTSLRYSRRTRNEGYAQPLNQMIQQTWRHDFHPYLRWECNI